MTDWEKWSGAKIAAATSPPCLNRAGIPERLNLRETNLHRAEIFAPPERSDVEESARLKIRARLNLGEKTNQHRAEIRPTGRSEVGRPRRGSNPARLSLGENQSASRRDLRPNRTQRGGTPTARLKSGAVKSWGKKQSASRRDLGPTGPPDPICNLSFRPPYRCLDLNLNRSGNP